MRTAIRRLRAAALARAHRTWAREVATRRRRRRAAAVGLARTLRRSVGAALQWWARRLAVEREAWAEGVLQHASEAAESIAGIIIRLRDGFCQACAHAPLAAKHSRVPPHLLLSSLRHLRDIACIVLTHN
jgi:hypothetical protein